MRVAVLTFSPRSGTGTQTITGVADADGPFTGKYFFFQSAYAALDTVTSGGIPTNAYMDARGLASGAIGSGGVGVAHVCADVSTAGIKDAGSMLDGAYCVSDYNAQLAFGGAGLRHAYISAIASGSFELTYDQNDRTGDVVLCTVLGGDDLTLEEISLAGGSHSTSAKPQGVLALSVSTMSGTKGALTGTGGENVCRGWDTRDGVRGATFVNVPYGNPNTSLQVTDSLMTSGDAANTVQVTAWGDTSLTITNGPAAQSATVLAVCGTNIRCAAGVLTQPTTASTQPFTTGIHAKWICFIGNGQIAGASATTVAQSAVGWATPTAQVGFWTGESGGAATVTGARYLSNSTVIRFGTPNTTSTTFDAVAALGSLEADGSASLTWTTVDSTQRQVLWFAIGEAVTTPPTPSYTTRTLTRRRLRRSPIVWAEGHGLQTRVRVNLFAVDLQPATATTDVPDPQVMVRASKDGGRTWTDWRQMSAGTVGHYTARLNSWRWGSGRQWVFEVACADPVTWHLVQTLVDAEPGLS